ncbi:DUF4926 domain-containing protein [Paenibacillus sp. LjRoot56]|uniref:DUF4926 domain-containing protein n=1 Tax=Paenibacillus sp. LjRoot56 TaxID=3342333 RepID=UPI003ED0C441
MRLLKQFDVVRITKNLPEYEIIKGQSGTILEIYDRNNFEIEICDENGTTLFLGALSRDCLETDEEREKRQCRKTGSTIGVIASLTYIVMLVCLAHGIGTFNLCFILLPSLLAFLSSLLTKPLLNIIATVWLVPACLYFTFGPFILFLHLAAIIFLLIGKRSTQIAV